MKKLLMFNLIICCLSAPIFSKDVSYQRLSLDTLGRNKNESTLDFVKRVGTDSIIENLMKTGNEDYLYVINFMNTCREDMQKAYQQVSNCYNVSVNMVPKNKKKGTKETRAVKKAFKKKKKKKAKSTSVKFLLADQKEWARIKRADVKNVSLDYSPERGRGCEMCKDFDPIPDSDDFDPAAFRDEYCSEPCSIEPKTDPTSIFFFHASSRVPEKRRLMITKNHWCGGQMSVPADGDYAAYFKAQKGHKGKSYVVNLTGNDVTLYHKKGSKKEHKETLAASKYVVCNKSDITVQQGTFTQEISSKNNVHLISMKDGKPVVQELNTKK